jgi:hypothetical protein
MSDNEQAPKQKEATKSSPKSKRTQEELKQMGIKGNLTLLARYAFSLAKENDYKDTRWENSETEHFSGGFYGKITPEKGTMWRAEEDDASFKAVVAAGKAAQADIAAQKYTDKVVAFLEAIMNVKAPVAAKSKDYSKVSEISLD